MCKTWEKLTNVILYGNGNVARGCIAKIKRDFVVDFIIDKEANKYEKGIYGLRVLSENEGLLERTEQKIIVMTGGRVYKEIAESLIKKGLIEHEDFCSIEYLITYWYWNNKNENNLMELHMALTMNCTLRCKDCNMFVPYYKNEVYYAIEEIESELDLLFSIVDNVFCLTFLGGEPLLYKELTSLLVYIGDNYIDRISSIKIVSNGTVVPGLDLLETAKGMPVWFSISDYTNQVSYEKKLKEVESTLDTNHIDYRKSKDLRWCSFGFPQKTISIKEESCRNHMEACSPIFHGYNDGKIYYCHVAWSAEKTGKYQLAHHDYLDLKNIKEESIDRHIISRHCFGEIDGKGYVSFCKKCGGCGYDNTDIVDAGVQT